MSQMLQMAQVFVSKSGSNIGCHVAQIFIDIHNEARNTLTEFNSNNTRRLNLQETIDTIAKLEYIQGRLAEDK